MELDTIHFESSAKYENSGEEENNTELAEFGSLESSSFCCVLCLASDSLGLLSSAAGQTGRPPPGPDQGLSLSERACIDLKRPSVMEERDACGQLRKSRLLKMYRDRFYLYRILIATMKDVGSIKKPPALASAVNETRARVSEEQALLQEAVVSTAEFRKLSAQLEQEKATSRFRLGRAHVEICNLEHKAHDSNIVSDIKCRLVDRWESSRREQLQLCRRMEEDTCKDVTRILEVETLRELRVHGEKKLFFERMITQYEHSSQVWADRYRADILLRDAELRSARARLRDLHNATERVRETLRSREQEMTDYIEYREAKRREEEMLREMNNAATKIQAWWRGTICRRTLKKSKTKGKDRKTPEGKKIK